MKKKISYIWDYYKGHIFVALVLLYIVSFCIYRATHNEPAGLYVAMVNVITGDDLHSSLIEEYPSCEIYTYENLVLTENIDAESYSYVQASEIKILGAIQSERLDVVIMDEEAMKAFIRNEYLYNLHLLLKDEELLSTIEDDIYQDCALNISSFPMIQDAGFPSDVYLGVIANTTHPEESIRYISYLQES